MSAQAGNAISAPAEGVFETDLLVIGGGMGGLTAAAVAARAGARVLLVEKAPEVGGSAAISEGYLWTAPTLEDLLGEDPDADRELGRALADNFLDGIEWVGSIGAGLSERLTGIYGFGHGHQTDIVDYLRRCHSIVEANGGWVVTGAETRRLDLDGGRVIGASVRDRDGEEVSVRAGATVIATGGFQGDRDMRMELIGEHAELLQVRANPVSRGDGLRLGRGAGGAVTEGVHGFYGHLVASPLEELRESGFITLAQLHSGYSLLVGVDGHRFTDETMGDHVNNQQVYRQPQGRAILVADEHVRTEYAMASYLPGMDKVDKFALAREAGAHIAVTETIAELAAAVSEWGVDGEQLVRTVEEYNRAIVAGGEAVSPTSLRYNRPLEEPPYYAVEVQSAITFPYAGLEIDARARVQRGDGPLPGLYAAGVDAGGVYKRGYAGGLSRGLVFGMLAARDAVGEGGAQ